MCVSLHVHSEYSIIDGLSKISEIADRTVEIGAPACGLTDHGVVQGHLEFDKIFRKRNLKPIFGCELYHGEHFGIKKPKRDQSHLIAFAQTDEGLKNLWRLNDISGHEDHFHHVGRLHMDDLSKHKEGIIFTSACAAGKVPQGLLRGDTTWLNEYLEAFGDNFYIELSTYPGDAQFHDKDFDEPISPQRVNELLWEVAQERGIPCVYGDDGHYAFKWQFPAHDAYVAKAMGQSIYTPIEERKMWHPEGALCIKTEEEVRESLSYLPERCVDECITNSHHIAETCDAHLPEVQRRLPTFIPDASPWVEKGKYADDEGDLLFIDLLQEGQQRRYGDNPPEEVVAQTAKEAEVFLDPEHGLFNYFLLAWDALQFCDRCVEFCETHPEFAEYNPGRPIERGPGRGSSAGSIAAYELYITDIDPLRWDLIFERFWNPGRAKGFPDIDSDIEKGLRWLFKRYLEWRWGHRRVRSIGTIGRMTPIALLKTLGPTCGLQESEIAALRARVKRTPKIDILGPDAIGWSSKFDPKKPIYVMEPTPDYPDNDVGEQIREWVGRQSEKRQRVLNRFLDLCELLCNRVANAGVHASGVVISSDDLDEIAPSRFAASKDQRIPVTQFPMDDIDALMLVKFDALGLRTLDVLADWKKQMKEKHGIEIEWSGMEWEDYPIEFWQQLWEGYAAGIFQIEKGFPKELCKKFRPANVQDFSIILALNRPGPIGTGAPASFIRRRAGEEEIEYAHPFLEDILQPTYGWFLYQEGVIRYFSKLGYSLSDADAVRKILGKKQPEKWADLYEGNDMWEGKSYLSMTEKAGIDRESADLIWAGLKKFAEYSFNMAHTAAYGTISFRTNFCKFYGPSEFYMAAIRNVDHNKKAEQIPRFVNEARRKGIRVFPPDIERSQSDIDVINGDVYLGFTDVKNVGNEPSKYIMELREEGAPIGDPNSLYEYVQGLSKARTKENAKRKKEGLPPLEGKSPGQRLNSKHIESLYSAGAWERLEGYKTPLRELQAREKEMLQVILSDNVADAVANNIDDIEALDDTYEELNEPYDGEDRTFIVPGVITGIEEKKQRNGKTMGIITIEWEEETTEFSVFADQWTKYTWMMHERTPGIFHIKRTQYTDKDGNEREGRNFVRGTMLQ
jgi:DNA polymerase-3 subunit alpha